LNFGPEIFALKRINDKTRESVTVLINVTNKQVQLKQPVKGRDLLDEDIGAEKSKLEPYQICWIKETEEA
jgi:hypothetical protein